MRTRHADEELGAAWSGGDCHPPPRPLGLHGGRAAVAGPSWAEPLICPLSSSKQSGHCLEIKLLRGLVTVSDMTTRIGLFLTPLTIFENIETRNKKNPGNRLGFIS